MLPRAVTDLSHSREPNADSTGLLDFSATATTNRGRVRSFDHLHLGQTDAISPPQTGRLISGQASESVYDYRESRYINMSGDITSSNVSAYDFATRCYISGPSTLLYHYGNNAHLALELNAREFSGYDYDSMKHFSGSVDGKNISLFDYEIARYCNFSI